MKKDWVQKLHDSKDLPRVEPITKKMSKLWGSGTLVIPAPIEVDAFMKRVPHGRLTTIQEIREALAKKHHATIACPLTTGIFAWIAAYASEQTKHEGKTDTTPYWRTLKAGGQLNEKYPGGIEPQKKLLEKEGHTVVMKGNRAFVQQFEQSLAHLTP
ncbi:MAG TPA: MGMT family protein [Patescibacteria group bacterium]|nr:MGMT family protein [Patescibacteria group bacterium]